MLNNYQYSQKRFDAYGAFYSEENGFVSFETGEVMYVRKYPKIYERRYFSNQNVDILTSRANIKPHVFLHPITGTKIPQAQLGSSQQMLLVDINSKKIVRLETYSGEGNAVPKHMRSAAAWTYAGNTEVFSGRNIHITKPFEKTPESKLWIKSAIAIAKLMPSYPTPSWDTNPHYISESILDNFTPAEYIITLTESVATYKMGLVTNNGIRIARVNQTLTHMMLG